MFASQHSSLLIKRNMTKKVCAETRAFACFYREYSRLSYRKIAAKCGISKSTAHRVCGTKKRTVSACVRKKGRPKCLNEREQRLLLRVLKYYRKKYVNFSVKDLMVECGFDSNRVHPRTISIYLNRDGFYMRQARKKGLLNDKDNRLRLSYAREMKRVLREHPDYYANHVAFYLDAVSFVHKNDPRKAAVQPKSRVWRKKGEGLAITTKGSKALAGGRRLHVLAAVAWGKGIILSEVYDKMNGDFFAQFIKNNFNLCFGKAGPKTDGKRLFVMDNDPCQTSKKAMLALTHIECELHRIPPCSPDINPIENIFHLVKKNAAKGSNRSKYN